MRPITDGPIPPKTLLVRNDRLVVRVAAARLRVRRAAAKRDQIQARIQAVTAEIARLQGLIQANQAESQRLQPVALEFAQARDAATARLLGRPEIQGPVPTGLPLLLLPVRLETRFMPKGDVTELCLRIYPDDIHVSDHEPSLTEMERQWGENYWVQLHEAGDDTGRAQRAWQQLQGQFGPQRAAWIARTSRPGSAQTAIRGNLWGGAPHTDMLPDRFVAVGFSDERPVFTAWGQTIPDSLNVGLTPDGEAIDPASGLPPVDEGLRWLIDFDAAMAKGMAMRIPLTPDLASRGLDRLLVLGLKASVDAGAATVRLQSLLESHQYTDGLALLGAGTPTNNTETQASAFHSLAEAEGPGLETGAGALPADSQGGRLAWALGLAEGLFAGLDGAADLADGYSRLMQQLLWETLSSPLKGQLLAAGTDAAALGQHFAEFVRTLGPLAPVRVGRQPYGLLPVTSVVRWDAGDQTATGKLAAWWRGNRERWRALAVSARAFDDGSGALSPLDQNVGSRQAVAAAVAPPSNPPAEPTPIQVFIKGLLEHAMAKADGDTQTALRQLPEDEKMRLAADVLDALAYRADAWAASLATAQLARLRQRQPNGLAIGAYGWLEHLRPAPPLTLVSSGDSPLWEAPGNHGHFQAPSLTHAAAACLLRSGFVDEELADQGAANPFAVDLSSARVRRSLWLLDGVRQGQSLSTLLGYRFERALHEQNLDVYIDRFRRLLGLSGSDKLRDLLTRLNAVEDEWMAFRGLELEASTLNQEKIAAEAVHAQLDAGRQFYQSVIDNINAMPARVQALQTEAAQVQQQAALLNEPQKPSSTQGSSAGVLEPADVEAQQQQRLNLELQAVGKRGEAAMLDESFRASSANLAQAQQALVRLQDASRPETPAALQARIGEVASRIGAINADLEAMNLADILHRRETIAARLRREIEGLWNDAGAASVGKMTDGIELRRRWRLAHDSADGLPQWSIATIPFGTSVLGFPNVGSADFGKLTAALAELDDLVDGIGDVMMAESVYQIVQGNPLRSGASLDAIATGEVPPPRLDMVRTPRSGVQLTHRFISLMPIDTASALARWPAVKSPRALAEPRLNAWLAGHLPDPATVVCRVLYRREQNLLVTQEATLAELNLAPLDCLYLVNGDDKPQQSELEQRLAELALRRRPVDLPTDATVELAFGRDESWPLERRSFVELLEMLRALHQLVLSARSLLPRDLALPGATSTAGELDLAELRLRLAAAEQELRTQRDGLLALTASQGTTVGEFRDALMAAAQLGVSKAIPQPGTGSGDSLAALRMQAESVVRQLEARLAQLAQTSPVGDDDPTLAFQAAAARMNLVFGTEFRVLPLIKSQDAELQASFDASASLQAGDALAAANWVQRVAKVREGLTRWSSVQLYSETLGVEADLRVGQLPFAVGDRWIALPFSGPMPQGRIAIVAHSPDAGVIGLQSGVAGLLVDEWTEVVPHQQEQTGLGFHFDQPNSAPPNSLLLAVSGDNRPVWDLDSLTTILNESLDLAKVRTAPADGTTEAVWFSDQLPAGARAMSSNESWSWTHRNPLPPTSNAAHQSALVAGMHQHFFDSARERLQTAMGDRLYVYVYLDPQHPPRQLMVQWNCSDNPSQADWEHRAYWGEHLIPWGVDGTASCLPMGPLPPVGRWCRLEVPATSVAVAGRPVHGMAFTLFDGQTTWGAAGRLVGAATGGEAATWVSYEAATAGG